MIHELFSGKLPQVEQAITNNNTVLLEKWKVIKDIKLFYQGERLVLTTSMQSQRSNNVEIESLCQRCLPTENVRKIDKQIFFIYSLVATRHNISCGVIRRILFYLANQDF